MDVSVVVPTLNDRDELRNCLDALAGESPDEIVVVNGPSTDGTTGMVRDRDDVDVLVEIDDRNVNVARNAGLDRAQNDAIAFVDPIVTVDSGWLDAVVESLSRVDVVTGPTHQQLRAGVATDSVESKTIRGRSVTYFDGGNVAFTRDVLEALDGFDEYLDVGGARDVAHRIAGLGYATAWVPQMGVSREIAPDGGTTDRDSLDDGTTDHDWRRRYRSVTYRLAKNYGLHPTVPLRATRRALADAISTLGDVLHGEARPTSWLGNGREVVVGGLAGYSNGLRARYADRTPRRNPNGWRARTDRAVAVYDRR